MRTTGITINRKGEYERMYEFVVKILPFEIYVHWYSFGYWGTIWMFGKIVYSFDNL